MSGDENVAKRILEEQEEVTGSNKIIKVSSGDDVKTEAKKPEEERLSKDAGRLLICGMTNWDLIGRKDKKTTIPAGVNVSNLYGPHAWGEKEKIRVKSVASSSVSCHACLITEEGKVMAWGRNENGQLGVGDTVTRYRPTYVSGLDDHVIVQVATGRRHTLFLTDKGAVLGCGDNKMSQLGTGKNGDNELIPVKLNYNGKPIVRITCGGEFSMVVDLAGTMFSFGCPEYGQLGHNSDGQMLERAGKISYQYEHTPRRITTFVEKNRGASSAVKEVEIVDVKCSANHSVAFDTKGRVYTWGFGGYGRLGHAETKDEMVPRLVKQLENMRFFCKQIAAGSSFCLAADTNKMIYFWGQNKPSGEATMYPKPIQDLCGWNIRSIACANKSIVVAADESVISWGCAPTYGELGYGENRQKSSTTPQEVKPLEGIHVKEVSCGNAYTLMIARDETEEDRKMLKKLPCWA